MFQKLFDALETLVAAIRRMTGTVDEVNEAGRNALGMNEPGFDKYRITKPEPAALPENSSHTNRRNRRGKNSKRAS